MEDAYGSSSWNSWSMDVFDPGSDDAKKNNIVKGLLFQSIQEELVLQIGNLKTGKETWEAIKTRNLGVDRVKEARLQTLITEFENLKMLDNSTIGEYAAKLSGIATKSATLGEVMSEHKLVKKFLTSLPRRFVHIVAALEQVLDLKTTGFEDVVGRLKAYEERIKEEDKAKDPQENLLYAKTEYSNKNNDSSRGRERGSYSRGRGQGRGQGRGRDKSENQGQRDSSKNREDNEQKDKQHEKRDLSHIQCYCCDQYGHFVPKCPEQNRNHEVNLNETQEKGVYHEQGTFFMMNHIQETIFMNEEKYPPPKSESNTNKDDVWYFDNGANNHMTGKNGEHKLLKDVYYIPALRSNVISLGQTTISGYDISIRGEFLTMRDSWGGLLIKVPRNENRLYKAQLKVGKENINEVGQESGTFTVLCNDIQENDTNEVVDEETNPHSSLVTDHETSPESKEDHSISDDTPIPIARLETIRLLISLAAGKGWKIHHLEVKTAFINGDRKKLDSTLKELGFLQCVHEKAVYRKENGVSQGKDCVEIKQEGYVKKILKEAGMEDCNLSLCPTEPGLKLSKAEDEPEVEATQYRKMSKRITCSAIKQTLCYLKGTTLFGMKYNRSNDMKLVGYTDSSHNVDIDDGRSTTRHVFYLGTLPVTWCSQKQTTVALSSCEAEFMAATSAACQAIWLKELLAKVTGLERQKVIIRVDNKSAIALSKNLVFHGRSKHIHTRYHFIRECLENEQVIVEHVSRENQRADPLTKALARIRFKEMRSLLGVQELPSSTQKFKG
ncbi:uncharacterized mitochondrial protein-like protein [Tanacetum coccineum]